MIYEWDSATDPSKTSLAIRRSWPYPKKVFDLYKSAEAHTKRGNRVPVALWLAALAVIAVPIVGYVAINRTAMKWTDDSALSDAAAATEPATAQSGFGNALQARTVMPERLIEAMTPTDDQNPLSAPLYAAVVPPVVAPEIVGCISSRKSCTCYSQQQTPVWLPEPQCRERAAGLYYDPYRQVTRSSEYGVTPDTQKTEPVNENPEIL